MNLNKNLSYRDIKYNDIIKAFLMKKLKITEKNISTYNVESLYDFRGNAVRNQMWYRGNAYELRKFYSQIHDVGTSFWGTSETYGNPIRRVHVDLPKLIVKTLTNITVPDLNEIKITDDHARNIWESTANDNNIEKFLEKVVKKVLISGDGAVKIGFKEGVSKFPILEFYSAENVKFIFDRGVLVEIQFYNYYDIGNKKYTLVEKYGYGYIEYELYNDNDKQISIKSLDITSNITNIYFDNSIMLATSVKFFESEQFEYRGESIYEGKQDAFDAIDEIYSTWIDAIRAGRVRTYIPDSLIPRDLEGGYLLKPNPFSNNYIKIDNDNSENGKNQITVSQADIKTDALLSSYTTTLDMILQGVLSSSTLGIDSRKIDSAEAQREREKTTLYTRRAIIDALQVFIKDLVLMSVNAYQLQNSKPIYDDLEMSVVFGEYASPSFEALCETLAKARPGKVLMSREAAIEEMWGNDKDEKWKAEEAERIKEEENNTSQSFPDNFQNSEIENEIIKEEKQKEEEKEKKEKKEEIRN